MSIWEYERRQQMVEPPPSDPRLIKKLTTDGTQEIPKHRWLPYLIVALFTLAVWTPIVLTLGMHP